MKFKLSLITFVLGSFIAQISFANELREDVIRKLIKSNLHFSVHCMCRAITDETMPAVLKKISESDIPVLINLLGDDDVTKYGAEKALVFFGEASLPELKRVVSLRDGRHAAAVYVVSNIEAVKSK
ncbi:hypothetical protein [Undibacterium flavidum]|uniref:HEAT repeat domain-containing protein n=1 Tax=Undibacterium flavidum TaxID=2762297 RepID=A0ABR6Y918_9BURK|nr:hypothetical protein [Undibacterium flavidum]MBC3873081.1 hypothetical protein [Undibacterium flavidum]